MSRFVSHKQSTPGLGSLAEDDALMIDNASVEGARFDLFAWLSVEARKDFVARARERRLGSCQIIYQRGDRGVEMYRILAGTVRLSTMRADGREMGYILFGPGDCFGVSTLLDGEGLPHTAESLGTTRLQILDDAHFRTLRDTHRDFDDALLRLMSRQMRILSTYLADVTLEPLPRRAARRLLEIARRDASGQLLVHLSQSDLARLLGVSRQTTNKLLKQFEQDGLITLNYRSIKLIDLNSIRLYAQSA